MRSSIVLAVTWLFLAAGGAFAQSDVFTAKCEAAAKKAGVARIEDNEEIRGHELVRAKPIRTDKLGADIHVSVAICVRVDSAGNVVSVDGAELPPYLGISDAATYEKLAQQPASSFRFSSFVREGHPVSAELIEYVSVLPPEQRPDVRVAFPGIHD